MTRKINFDVKVLDKGIMVHESENRYDSVQDAQYSDLALKYFLEMVGDRLDKIVDKRSDMNITIEFHEND